jgi:hypothetical protein
MWTCKFCHATSAFSTYPPSWGRIVRSRAIVTEGIEVLDACQDCLERIEATGSYSGVPRGAYVPEGR